MSVIKFFVPGIPQPGGSKKAFVIPGTNRANIVEDCKRNAPWRNSVQTAALQVQCIADRVFDGPLFVSVVFYLPRPKNHYGSGKNAGLIKASAPRWPTVKPDTTKLFRALEDALKGIAWTDDNQVVKQIAVKAYADNGQKPGAFVMISSLNEG